MRSIWKTNIPNGTAGLEVLIRWSGGFPEVVRSWQMTDFLLMDPGSLTRCVRLIEIKGVLVRSASRNCVGPLSTITDLFPNK